MLRTPRTSWPAHAPVTQQKPPVPPPGGIAATFIGHSTFLIQTPAGNVLTDPVWSRRVSPVAFAGPKRHRAPGVKFEDLPSITLVLLSHNHYDHCDLATLRRIAAR
ncbi:MAG TPA: MBL fold metallo-hydrolase, partial [Gemmatimonadales bacterium]